MRKKLLMLTAVLAVSLFAGCAEGGEQTPEHPTPTTKAEESGTKPGEAGTPTNAPTKTPEATAIPTTAVQETLTPTPEPVIADVAGEFKYTIENGQVTITGLTVEKPVKILVPETIEGFQVTKLAENAFANQVTVGEIILPNGLLEIGKGACRGLDIEILVIPASVTVVDEEAYSGCVRLAEVIAEGQELTLGKKVFDDCPSLTKASLPGVVLNKSWYSSYGFDALTSLIVTEGVTEISEHVFKDITKLKYVYLPDSVTKIGAYAFSYCKGLVDIRLPESLTEIGNNAFESCESLLEIRIPNAVHTVGKDIFIRCTALKNAVVEGCETPIYINSFYDCTSLESVTLPGFSFTNWKYGRNTMELPSLRTVIITDGSTVLEAGSFADQTRITTVILPDSLLTIGTRAFENCTGLTEVELPVGVKEIGNRAFYGCISLKELTLPEGITYLAAETFAGTGLTELVIPEGVAYLYERALANCTELVSVQLPGTLAEMQSNVFQGCSSLIEVVLPENLAVIGAGAFNGCISLKSVSIPSTAVQIYGGLFAGCSSLNEIKVAEGNPIYSTKDTFGNECNALVQVGTTIVAACAGTVITEGITTIDSNAFFGQTGITELVIPENVQTIGYGAFQGCTNLVSVTLPSGLTELAQSLFSGCSSLKNIALPEALARIERDVFRDCDALEVLVIPESVNYIGTDVVADCENLKQVYVEGNISKIESYLTPKSSFELILGEKVTKVPDKLINTLLTESIVIEGNITSGFKFSGCEGLKRIVVNGTVSERYLTSTFSNCSNLEYVVLPEGITELGDQMFSCCTKLAEIYIPESVTEINKRAFVLCPETMTVYTPAGSYAETWAKEKGYNVMTDEVGW